MNLRDFLISIKASNLFELKEQQLLNIQLIMMMLCHLSISKFEFRLIEINGLIPLSGPRNFGSFGI